MSMWPVKEGLGVQLGYGLQGSNIYLDQLGSNEPWLRSRERANGLNLAKVHNSSSRLVPPQLARLDVSDIKKDLYVDALRDIPENLITHEDVKGDEYLASQYVYDPSIGNFLDIEAMRTHGGSLAPEVIAYVSGDHRNVLVVQFLERRTELVHFERNELGSDEEEVVDPSEVKIPTVGNGNSIDLESPILQIEIAKSSVDYPIWRKLIFVRTLSAIYIINPHLRRQKDEIDLEISSIFNSEDLKGNDFSHITNDPVDSSQFAIIDNKGNWCVCKMSAKNLITIKYTGFVNDFEDYSRFKRVCWSSDQDELLIMSRNYVKKVKLQSGETTDLITAKKWSEVREFLRSDSDDDYGFLLTSREIIWVDLTKNFRRILSWKHYLDADDPSLTMNLKTVDDVHFISLHTQTHPLIIMFQFKMEDGFPKSIHDPIMIRTDSSSTAQNYQLLPIESDLFVLFQISTQLEVSRMLLSSKKAQIIKFASEMRRRTKTSESEVKSAVTTGDALLSKKNMKFLTDLSKSLFHLPKEQYSGNDEEVFQEYALSFDVDKFKRAGPKSLLRYSNTSVGNFEDFGEFENMIEQLQEYLKNNGASVITFKELSNLISNYEVISRFDELKDTLEKFWKSLMIAKKATTEVSLSLSIVYDEDHETKKLNDKVDMLPKKLKDIIDNWDNEYNVDDTDMFADNNDEAYKNEVQPIIQITQSQPNTQTQQSQAPLLRPKSTQMHHHTYQSQSMNSFSASQVSQSQASQSQKKKKRRIKGFA